jgi:hypothetical protein
MLPVAIGQTEGKPALVFSLQAEMSQGSGFYSQSQLLTDSILALAFPTLKGQNITKCYI